MISLLNKSSQSKLPSMKKAIQFNHININAYHVHEFQQRYISEKYRIIS